MNSAQYKLVVDETIAQIHSLGTIKGGEYAGDKDRLENFKRNARLLDVTPELIWAVYCNKHIDSINQYVQDVQQNRTRPRSESMYGRADDVIVYMILFKCLLKEREALVDPLLTDPPVRAAQIFTCRDPDSSGRCTYIQEKCMLLMNCQFKSRPAGGGGSIGFD